MPSIQRLTITCIAMLGMCASRPVLARRQEAQACPDGRFLVTGPPLVPDSQLVSDAIVVTDRTASIQSGCDTVRIRRKVKRSGTTVKARWSSCGTLRGVHLRVTIAGDCAQMSGILTARLTPLRTFSAHRLPCDPGAADGGAEAFCDPVAGPSGCPDGQQCTATCTCEPVETTTTTTSTTTSSTTTTTAVPAQLASLAISPLDLRPAFSGSIHDYVVACSGGTNHLMLDAGAALGGSVSLVAPITTAPDAALSMAIDLQENEAAVVRAAAAGATTEDYWIRCLPHDFPLLSAVPHPETGEPTPGWYLMGNVILAPGSGGYAMIVDQHGTPVWYRTVPGGVVCVEPFPDQSVAISPLLGPAFGTDPSRGFTIYDLDTLQAESVLAIGVPTDHHEILLLPNGNRLLLAYPLESGVDLTGLQSFGADSTIADCVVQEQDAAGNLVWEWRASDHVDPVRESTFPSASQVGTQTVVDVYHCNSIDVNADGDLLVSARHMDAVFLVSRDTGQIVWKLGGAPFSKDGAQLLEVQDDTEVAFYRQHDARFRPNGDVSLFDDHSFVTGPARGVEYAIDFTAGTARPVWEYRGDANSVATGSFRRYPDGHSVIGWGLSNSPENVAFSELDASAQDVLDMLFVSRGNWLYRALKVPLEAFDTDVLRNTAGAP